MAKLRSLASVVLEEMTEKGKVVEVTLKESSSIDYDLAMSLKKIQREFEVKEKNSRAYVSKIELSALNH